MDSIRHTYCVVEEGGMWYVVIDNEIHRNISYRTEGAAQRIVDRLTVINNMWIEVFTIETKIAKALEGKAWPYGATCVNTGTNENPIWILTEPYRDDDEAVRTVTPDPTGYVQINIYNRELYETACSVAGIDLEDDKTLYEKFITVDDDNNRYTPDDVEPIEAVKNHLEYRRFLGIAIEKAADYSKRLDVLKEAGLLDGPYSRGQYEIACGIMGVSPLDDGQVIVIMATHVLRDMGLGVISPGLPNDIITGNLAYRRAVGIEGIPGVGDDDPGDEK
jgi:hypothetical protein